MITMKPWSWALLLSVTTGVATAQEPPAAAPPAPGPAPAKAAPRSTAQIDAGEPRADTSAPPPTTPPATAPTGKPARPAARAAAAARPGPAGPAGTKAPGTADRLDLGTATVTGDREQPKVMYIVPWKKSDIGDQSGKPMNSLLDEALAPVDRDEFKREVAYYDAVRADTPQNGASKQGER